MAGEAVAAIRFLIAEDRKDRAEREADPDRKPTIGDLPGRCWYFTGSGWASYDPGIYCEGDE